MEPLDGNAIGGALYEYFGDEMTAVVGSCTHCGTSGQIAELTVFMRAPGAVARCSSCGEVVLVLIDVREQLHIELTGYRLTPH
jgi:hypothetical protein